VENYITASSDNTSYCACEGFPFNPLKTQHRRHRMSYDRYNRKHSITLCFNDEEFAQVEELASMLKKPRATAVRDLILNKDFKLKKK
jgi:hypothetical protein